MLILSTLMVLTIITISSRPPCGAGPPWASGPLRGGRINAIYFDKQVYRNRNAAYILLYSGVLVLSLLVGSVVGSIGCLFQVTNLLTEIEELLNTFYSIILQNDGIINLIMMSSTVVISNGGFRPKPLRFTTS